MRSMSVSGCLAMIIVGGLVLDHLWIVAVLALFAGVFLLCYSIGKNSR